MRKRCRSVVVGRLRDCTVILLGECWVGHLLVRGSVGWGRGLVLFCHLGNRLQHGSYIGGIAAAASAALRLRLRLRRRDLVMGGEWRLRIRGLKVPRG